MLDRLPQDRPYVGSGLIATMVVDSMAGGYLIEVHLGNEREMAMEYAAGSWSPPVGFFLHGSRTVFVFGEYARNLVNITQDLSYFSYMQKRGCRPLDLVSSVDGPAPVRTQSEGAGRAGACSFRELGAYEPGVAFYRLGLDGTVTFLTDAMDGGLFR